jgi:conjugative transfer signal peptidase TraF
MALNLDSAAPLFVIAGSSFGLAAVLLIGRLAGLEIVINATASEPAGFYRIVHPRSADFHRGMLVIFPVPAPFESLVYGRGWEKKGVPLLKGIGALAGDTVCIRDTVFEINGTPIGPVAERDQWGLPLPKIRGCFQIEAGYFLPVSAYNARSFDGRYLGPQPLSAITGEAKPLWTF